MTGLTVLCPSCRQTIRNAAPSPENKIHCGGCGAIFAVPPTARPAAPPPVLGPADVPTVLKPHVPGVARPPGTAARVIAAAGPAEKPPLGPEPPPASYGLLIAVAWATLAFALVLGGWQVYAAIKIRNFGGLSVLNVVKQALLLAQLLLLGVAGVCMVNCIVRLDRRAAWIAWRSGALFKAVGEPLGSSLPFILPWAVAGGVLLSTGMRATFAPDASLAMFGAPFMAGGLTVCAAGALLFLSGLGCGELRRFFWRMAQMGKTLPRRKRGGELSIGVPQTSYGQLDIKGSSAFIFVALGMLFICYATLFVSMYSSMSALSEMQAARGPQAGQLPNPFLSFIGYSLAGFLGIVGGAFTMFLLSNLWNETLQGWHFALRSIGEAGEPGYNSSSTGMFVMAGKIVAWGIGVCAAYLLYKLVQMGGRGVPASMWIFAVCLPICVVSFVLWLRSLKRESFSFVQTTSVMPLSPLGPRGGSPGIGKVAFGLIVVTAIQLLWIMVEVVNMFSQLFSRGMGGFDVEGLMAMVGMILLMIALSSYPSIWCAMILQDLDRAACNLEGCTEVEPL